MSAEITLYEDTGPASGGAGTTRTEVSNIGWKSEGSNDTANHYSMAPIIRSENSGGMWARSFKKYNFAKIVVTDAPASRVRIKISNGITGAPPAGYEGETSLTGDTHKARIFYKLTNVYEEPGDAWDGTLTYLDNGSVTLYPSVSTTGPNGTQQYPQYLSHSPTPGTTYYTQYLVTQLIAPVGTNSGNIGDVNIEWIIDEYEDGNV